MANETLDVQDLAEGAEIQRRFFNCITPPDFSLFQPMFPPVVPFTATNFSDDFLDSLVGEDKNSVAIYPLSLMLDPKTRETLVYNAEGKLIATIPADGRSRTWSENADPARVILRLDLLPSEDVEPYLYTEDRVAEADTSMTAKSAKIGKIGRRNMMVGNTNFGISGFQHLTNGNMQLTVTNGTDVAEVFSYTITYTSSMTTGTWVNLEGETNTTTNTVWTPLSPSFNGLESDWQCQETNLVLTNGVGIWEDSNISSNDWVRFYGVAKRTDTDGDGLTGGAELFVYHTCPTNNDTDYDELSDSEEVNDYHTDPLLADTDGDGLSDGEEIIDIGTDPLLADTDRDGMSDGWEVENNFNAMSGITGPLVAWYRFDEGSGVAISNTVSSSYTGVLFNASTTNWIRGYTGGSNDYALWFDGSDDYVAIPTNQSGSVVTQAPFSVSAWVFQDAGMNKRWGTVFSDSGWNSTNGYITGYSLRVDTNYNSACYYVGCSTNYDGCYQTGWKESYVGRWVHIVATYAGTTMKLYVDGVLAQTMQAQFEPQRNPQLWIGLGHVNANDSHWQGAIDDVRFYNWAMGTQEVASLYEPFADADSDGLSNLAEFQAGTEPWVADTDGDGLPDGEEVNEYGTDPLVADTDGDGLDDGAEVNDYGTDPLVADTDHDGWRDGLDPDPKSRAWVDWGNPDLWTNGATIITNQYWPAWCKQARTSDGSNDFAASSYNVASNQPLYVGFTWIVVDTNLVHGTNMALWTHVSTSHVGQLYFQLRDMAWNCLVNNFLEVYNPQYPTMINTASLGPSGEILLKVPMSDAPSAANIICQRYTNAIAIYDSMLYMDADGDFLDDTQVAAITANPTNDYDGDGMADYWEYAYGLDFTLADQNGNDVVDGLEDFDGDGLSNAQESAYGANPYLSDTDDDGLPDNWEVQYGLDPTDSSDADLDLDEDGFTNFEEFEAETDPAIPGSHSPGAWYVATNGVDSATGGAYTNPLATLTNAFALAEDGNRVILFPGIYIGAGNRNVDFNDKSLVVSGLPGHDEGTIIDCEYSGRAFLMGAGESATIQYLSIQRGGAENGGAIAANGESLFLRSCHFVSNSADLGGAVWSPMPLEIENCVFDGNYSTNQGGAVYSGADLSCAGSQFICNTNASEGGAVYTAAGEASLAGCDFEGNNAGMGGAVYCVNDLLLSNCRFVANAGADFAGAVYLESGVITADHCEFIGNQANDGGAVYGPVIVATNCNFTSNSAVQAGAVYATYELNVSGCRFIGNVAGGDGGAVYLIPHFNSNSGFVLDDSRFEGNLANRGGAIYLDQNSATTTTISRCHFQNNEASYMGGAVNASAPCFIENSLFKSNRASLAAALYTSYNCTLQNCAVVNNEASYSSSEGAIISQYGCSPLSLENTIITGNTLPVIYLEEREDFPLSYTNCCLQDGMDLPVRDASFYHNPLVGIDGWHLLPNSPCINAGRNLTGMSSQTDLDGQSRIWGGTVDIGADESGAPDVDADNDGIPDWWEIHYGLDPAIPSDADGDVDGDGLTNLQEYQYEIDPRDPDSDGDGLGDGVEVSMGLDPADPDTDADGMLDGWEEEYGMDPLLLDSDEDGIIDGLQDPDHDGISTYMELLLNKEWHLGLDPYSYDELPDAGTWATSETSLDIYAPQQPCY